MPYQNRQLAKKLALQAVVQSRNMTLPEAAAYKGIHAKVLRNRVDAATGPTNSGTAAVPMFTKANLDAWNP